jgi:hypothetical protein
MIDEVRGGDESPRVRHSAYVVHRPYKGVALGGSSTSSRRPRHSSSAERREALDGLTATARDAKLEGDRPRRADFDARIST